MTAWAQAPCPPVEIRVDNDRAGSGYSEVHPENWASHNVGVCAGTYRYLSQHVGDGTRRGQAIWQPAIAQSGWYDVTISYRATVNRTDNARYLLFDDRGGQRVHVENQAHNDDCTRVDVGEIYCAAGGTCRVVLDGNNGESACADETIFQRTRCDGPDMPPVAGDPCDGIRQTQGFELCASTSDTCAGVFDNGAGCTAYCAAAGLICTRRLGGGAGCLSEPGAELPCGANNGHQSDWCECGRPPAPPPADAAPPAPPTPDGEPPASLPDAAVPFTPDAAPPAGTPDAAPPAAISDAASPADGAVANVPPRPAGADAAPQAGPDPLSFDAAVDAGAAEHAALHGTNCQAAPGAGGPGPLALMAPMAGLTAWARRRTRRIRARTNARCRIPAQM